MRTVDRFGVIRSPEILTALSDSEERRGRLEAREPVDRIREFGSARRAIGTSSIMPAGVRRFKASSAAFAVAPVATRARNVQWNRNPKRLPARLSL